MSPNTPISSNTSFFSFGLDDSFISKSFEGLRYRNLPPALEALIAGGSVKDVHWACLGPLPESWILSFKDSGGKENLGWGSSIPQRLQNILSKASPSPHIRAFLGPKDSYIAWSPNFVRWANLPASLEDSLQSWLTPSGWKSGPPRVATWGPEDAFFAMSEYGDVVYRVGNGDGEMWEIFKETVEEWKSEKGFAWSEVVYIALDQTMTDQFIAIRNDGTWAGSIDDINEEALQAFALNYFTRQKHKSKSKPSQQPNGSANPANTIPDAATQALYEEWSKGTAVMFASALAANGSKAKNPRKLQIRSQSSTQQPGPTPKNPPPTIPTVTSGKLLTSFPYLPTAVTTCAIPMCVTTKADPASIRACKHDVQRLLKASGLYSYEWLRQERLRWHPDRFGRLCEEGWREEGKRMAEEMFKIVDMLVEELKSSRKS